MWTAANFIIEGRMRPYSGRRRPQVVHRWHRRRSRQILGVEKDILPEFPQTFPKKICAVNFHPTNFLQQLVAHYQLSRSLKRYHCLFSGGQIKTFGGGICNPFSYTTDYEKNISFKKTVEENLRASMVLTKLRRTILQEWITHLAVPVCWINNTFVPPWLTSSFFIMASCPTKLAFSNCSTESGCWNKTLVNLR